jgi:hypothetical protein
VLILHCPCFLEEIRRLALKHYSPGLFEARDQSRYIEREGIDKYVKGV